MDDNQDNQEQRKSSVDRVNDLINKGQSVRKNAQRLKNAYRGIKAARTAATAARTGAMALQGTAAAGEAAVATSPVWGTAAVIILIILLIIVVFVIVFAGAQSVKGGTPQDCIAIGGTCGTTCQSPNILDTSGASCSASLGQNQVCCVSGADLPPGVFKPPFACGLSYWGWTYAGHSAYSVDFNRAGDLGNPVLASANGRVVEVIASNGQVRINHAGGYQSLVAHMINIRVKVGDIVNVGQQIGQIDTTGLAIGSHLHVNHLLNGRNIKVSYNGIPYPNSIQYPTYLTPPGPLITGECP